MRGEASLTARWLRDRLRLETHDDLAGVLGRFVGGRGRTGGREPLALGGIVYMWRVAKWRRRPTAVDEPEGGC